MNCPVLKLCIKVQSKLFLRGKDFEPVTVDAGDIWPKDPDLYWDDIPAYDTPRLQLDEAVAVALLSRQKTIEPRE